MARAGGIGIIHRFMTAERQAEEVRRAKRAESHIGEPPMTVPCGATVKEARDVLVRHGIGGLALTTAVSAAMAVIAAVLLFSISLRRLGAAHRIESSA
jgi:IMP dehydrogenase